VTVVRERVVAPQTVRHIYEPAPPPHVVVHRAPGRVVQYEERPVYVEPPRTVVHAEYRQVWGGDVDIKSVKPELRFDRRDGHFWLDVRYDVETEFPSQGRLDLVLELLHHGAPLLDDRGEPIQFAVVLDRPSDVDDDEFEYESRFSVTMPPGGHFNPKKLKASCLVVDREYGDVLDTKVESVKFKD
jgi:hypothetical protein